MISVRYGYRYEDETQEEAFDEYADFKDFPKTLGDVKNEIKELKQKSKDKRKIIIFKILLEDIL